MTMDELKRKLNATLMLLPVASFLSNRKAVAMGRPPISPSDRFKGLGLTLVVDAVPGAKMLGNEFFADGSDSPFYASSVTRQGNRSIMAFPSGKVPESVRVVWRDSSEIVGRKDDPTQNTYAGKVLGDYTIPIASRIPDEVVAEIRKNGGRFAPEVPTQTRWRSVRMGH